jgi:putative N6-adenine-specific DNA methylase
MPARPHHAYVITPPGLEAVTAAEVRELGAKVPKLGHGGFAVNFTTAELFAANLWLRTASRIIVRIGRFDAKDKGQFLAGFRSLPFEKYLPVGLPSSIRVDVVASELVHTGVIEQLSREVLGSRGGATVRVRIDHDVVTVSVDTSGDHLHRRGWRQGVAKAPLRESLAAALLRVATFGGPEEALVDPMCGSGTIAIEAALKARRMAPGANRSFAFTTWPSFDPAVWERVRAKADDGVFHGSLAPIVGADRDAGAIDMARRNAALAGVAEDIEFRHSPISNLTMPTERGLVACNPPYGMRVTGGADLRDLYDAFGSVLRRQASGWRVALIAPDRSLVTRVVAHSEERATIENGGVPVAITVGTVDR